MFCKITVENNQSEFDFFQQLVNSPKDLCCGPLAIITFTDSSFTAIQAGLVRSGETSDHLDKYRCEVLDSSHLSFVMCSKHWVEITRKIGMVGTEFNNEIWFQLSFYIFRVLCLTNSWDHKEVVNYLKTLHMLNTSD